MSKQGGPAFPAINFIVPEELAEKDVHRLGETQGMYLRDWFAGMALQGYLASHTSDYLVNQETAAKVSYGFADAMLKERDK